MSEQANGNIVMVQMKKTAAPIILGIIAFVLWLPSLLCNVFCAALVADMNKGNGGGWVMLPSMISVSLFILSFFCKSKFSKTTGVIMILLGVLMMICHVILFNLLALASAILYIVAGAYSIANAKRPA